MGNVDDVEFKQNVYYRNLCSQAFYKNCKLSISTTVTFDAFTTDERLQTEWDIFQAARATLVPNRLTSWLPSSLTKQKWHINIKTTYTSLRQLIFPCLGQARFYFI